MMRTIQYAIDKYTGLIYSQVGNEIAVPVLDFNSMTFENGFIATYNLEKVPGHNAYRGTYLVWTRKIPNALKNLHREFWGMKPLQGKNRWERT